jgi:hypothetical protein
MIPDSASQQYEKQLENIETTIVGLYRQQPDLVDFNVDKVLDGLIRTYQAALDRAPKLKLTPLEQTLFEHVKAMCDWLMGLGDGQAVTQWIIHAEIKHLAPNEIVACLKRLRRSIKMWHKDYGRRGYLDYIDGFIKRT